MPKLGAFLSAVRSFSAHHIRSQAPVEVSPGGSIPCRPVFVVANASEVVSIIGNDCYLINSLSLLSLCEVRVATFVSEVKSEWGKVMSQKNAS